MHRTAAPVAPSGNDHRSPRPAVVESDSPQSMSDGRATTTGRLAARLATARRRPALLRQVGSFAAIGVLSTLAWAALYLVLRPTGLASVPANAIALIVTALGNTAANRRFTFGVAGRTSVLRHHGLGLVAFGFGLALTSAAATALHAIAPGAGRLVEMTVLGASSAIATTGRFVLLRAGIGQLVPVTTHGAS